MSWEQFDKLSKTNQKDVLIDVFKHTGLSYSVNTSRGYYILQNEYSTYDIVMEILDESMERRGV